MAVTGGDGAAGERTAVRVSAVVPTLGATPLLGECLRALRRQAPEGTPFDLSIVLVRQGEELPAELSGADLEALVDRHVHLPRPAGFAAAVDEGIAAAAGDYVATVNDDAVVGEGWLAALVDALETDPGAASAQGVNVAWQGAGAGDPNGERIDGRGLAWNRWVQAIQVGAGEPEEKPADGRQRRVFGVSATAALYRRAALLAVALPPRHRRGPVSPEVFDRRLDTYYEDVDLARRLRGAGYAALAVPAARARHAGSATGARMGARRWRLIYGNRYPVAAGLLGRALWRHLPRMLVRDLLDLGRSAADLDLGRTVGIVGGWCRALRLLPGFVRTGAPVPGAFAAPGGTPPARPEGRR